MRPLRAVDPAPGYREFAPPLAVAPLVECLWTRAGAAGDEVGIMPDGASDVIWRQGRGTMIVGPDTSARRYTRAGGELLIGLRLRPGAGGGAFGVPLDELRDLQVEAGAIDRAFDLDGDLTPAVVCRRLLAAVAGRLPDPIVLAAAPRIADGSSVAALAHEFSISERQLRRRFHAGAGYGPATLARVLRFQRFVSLLDRGGEDLAGMAFEAGYADQAHLSRESRRLAGLSPRAVMQARRSA